MGKYVVLGGDLLLDVLSRNNVWQKVDVVPLPFVNLHPCSSVANLLVMLYCRCVFNRSLRIHLNIDKGQGR